MIILWGNNIKFFGTRMLKYNQVLALMWKKILNLLKELNKKNQKITNYKINIVEKNIRFYRGKTNFLSSIIDLSAMRDEC